MSATGHRRLPCPGRWDSLSAGQQAVHRTHTKIRALIEQAVATLKSWRLLCRLRRSTTRITSPVQSRPQPPSGRLALRLEKAH